MSVTVSGVVELVKSLPETDQKAVIAALAGREAHPEQRQGASSSAFLMAATSIPMALRTTTRSSKFSNRLNSNDTGHPVRRRPSPAKGWLAASQAWGGGIKTERVGGVGRKGGAAGEYELRGEEQFSVELPRIGAGGFGQTKGAHQRRTEVG